MEILHLHWQGLHADISSEHVGFLNLIIDQKIFFLEIFKSPILPIYQSPCSPYTQQVCFLSSPEANYLPANSTSLFIYQFYYNIKHCRNDNANFSHTSLYASLLLPNKLFNKFCIWFINPPLCVFIIFYSLEEPVWCSVFLNNALYSPCCALSPRSLIGFSSPL